MIWFDIKELERGLINREISDRVIFNYLLGNLILYSISPYLAGSDSPGFLLIFLQIAVTLVITVVGTSRTYEINTSGDRRDYFKRFLSLSFVTGIRLFVFMIIAAIPIGIILGVLGFNPFVNKYSEGLFNLILMAGGGVLYYYMLTNSFKRVSHGHQNQPVVQ
ncbi:hypothetical protein [Algoriphagus aquimarinus]|uniref:Uncharacterized protein n=1 Tax=Algoriphagus aquimarinus TaxID=237018 RepID=A0A1I1B4G4_9BACT|nr:hypothetical protein [Algoriphagus aquimarinus]SFB43500.1 hypothetical protein SAMN04489723_11056 [Algoriphagus aquimarinus]